MEADMGAIETNFGLTPRIPSSSYGGVDIGWLMQEAVFLHNVERWVVRPQDFTELVSNAVLSTPPLVAYPIATPVIDRGIDIDELDAGFPLKVVGLGHASLRAGSLPEPEWEL
jgi:hypothetical protein